MSPVRSWVWLLVFLAASTGIEPGLREARERPLAVRSAAPRREVPFGREPGYAGNYDFSSVQNQIRAHRLQLAACLMRNPASQARQIRMTLRWEAQGALKQVELAPDAGVAVRDCMTGLARQWALRPHPGLQGFSYSVVLAPTPL